MYRKHSFKFLIIALCTLLVAPLTVVQGGVASASTQITAPRSVEFVYEIETESIKTADDTSVVVKLGDNVIYENDALKENTDTAVISMSVDSGVISAKFGKNGDYVLSVYKSDDTATVESVNVKITTDFSELDGFAYASADNFAAYKTEVANAAKNDDGVSLKVGDEYTIPSLKDIIDLSCFGYESAAISKTVYYASSGSSYYSSTTTNKISINTVGEYKFYATFKTDILMNGNSDSQIVLDASHLVEKNDGFYAAKTQEGTKLYAVKQSSGDYKYYSDEDCEVEVTDASTVTTTELVIPIFSFTITSTAPTVKSDSTYQENGYIDYKYSDISFTAKGNDVTTQYTLMYSVDGETNWAEAEEELGSDLSFTPEKKGYYRVDAKVVDCEGNSSEASTAKITVKDKYVTVKYKTSFTDWLSVNTVPFIFLCISAACLVGIILIIFIKPGEKKTVKVDEEDR